MLAFGIGLRVPDPARLPPDRRRRRRRRAASRSGATPSSASVVLVAVITPSGDPISLLALADPDVPLLRGRRSSSGGSSLTDGGRQGDGVTVRPSGREPAGAHPFELDPSSVEAIDALDAGRSVLVAAPTGSGKTVVAEHAVARALGHGRQGLLHDADQGAVEPEVRRPRPPPRRRPGRPAHRRQRHQRRRPGGGDDHRGAAQHDLRRRRRRCDGLRYVVLDEVHYLQDAYRGPVWEEVIIHLPPEVRAGVPVGHGVERRGAGRLDRRRCGARPRRSSRSAARSSCATSTWSATGRAERLHLLPTLVDGRPNPEAAPPRRRRRRARPAGGRPAPGARLRHAPPGRGGRAARRARTCSRPSTSSSAGPRATTPCGACLDAGLRLTTPEERARIRAIAEERTAGARPTTTSTSSATTAGWRRWRPGVAAHHAGMVPPFKEAVEACFAEGLVKVVFATETLALGINMPARSVVIEKLTQVHRRAPRVPHAGGVHPAHRAGRAAGHRRRRLRRRAVVAVRALRPGGRRWRRAARFALASAFRPTYNMAANLVRRYEPDEAHHLLNLSFAQYQADRDVVRLEARLERQQERLAAAARPRPRCERGDVEEYRDAACEAERRQRGPPAAVDGRAVDERAGPAPARRRRRARRAGRPGRAVASPTAGRRDRGCEAIDADGAAADARRRRLRRAARPRGHGRAARAVRPQQPRPSSSEVADQLRRGPARRRPPAAAGAGRRPPRRRPATAGRGTTRSPTAPTATPPAGRWARRSGLERELADLRRDGRGRAPSRWPASSTGCCGCSRPGATSTAGRSPSGASALARIYHECDLLVAEALRTRPARRPRPAGAGRAGVRASPTSTAGPAPPPAPWFPSADVRAPLGRARAARPPSCSGRRGRGRAARRPGRPTRASSPWPTRGRRASDLDDVLDDEDAVGRRLRPQRQAAHRPAAPARRRRPPIAGHRATAAGQAAEALFRGVVAASSTLGDVVGDDGAIDRATSPESTVTIRKGEAWGEPGALPPDGRGRAQPTPRPGRSSRRPGGPATRSRRSACSAATCAARSAGGATRRRLRRAAAVPAAGRPGRRSLRRRAPALVRGPPRRPAVVVAGPGRGGHERPVPRPLGRRPAGPPRRRPARRLSTPDLSLGATGSGPGRRLPLGHPPAPSRHRGRPAVRRSRSTSTRPTRCGSTASGSARPAGCRSALEPDALVCVV